MSEENAVFEAAYKVAYEAALEAANAAYGYSSTPVTDNEDTLELNFRKLWDAIRNHWAVITALTLLFAVLGFVYSQFLVTPQYQASVNLIVLTNNTENVTNQTVSNEYVTSARNLAKTYAHILNGSLIQNDVIEDLGLNYTYQEFSKMVKAEPLTDSQVIKITITSDSKDMSADIADAFLRIAPGDLNEIVEMGRCDSVSGVDIKENAVKPGLKRTVGLMGIIGFALGFAYALFKELQNHFIISSKDVKEILNLPVLGVIPTESIS